MSLPKNPTANCNYLVCDQIIFGQYPDGKRSDYDVMDNFIDDLINPGCNVYVNAATSSERRFEFDYVPRVKELIPESIFIDCIIKDGAIPIDLVEFKVLMVQLHSLIKEGKKLYIHCVGGHGRSAVIAGCLLVHMGYDPIDVLKLLKEGHNSREAYTDYKCPHTIKQSDFIRSYNI